MHPTPEVSALPDPHLTLYVLLAGVMGGLVLAVVVMVCCKVCLKKKKPLTRQHVVFSRTSERQQNRARKYHSLDSSVSVDIETSWGGMSDSSPSPREPKDFCPTEEAPRTVPTFPCMSPRSLPDIPENKTPEEEYSKAVGIAPQRAPDPPSRRRSSGGIQRQASICLSDDEDGDPTLYSSIHCRDLQSVKVEESSSLAGSGEYTATSSPPQSNPATPPACGMAGLNHHHHHTHKNPLTSSTTQIHAAVVHRSGELSASTAGRSPDRNSQCSCCRNSRGSQGSHSHNSSVDSGSTRTVIAVADHYGTIGTASSVSNGFSNGENDDGRWLKSCAEEDESRFASLTVSGSTALGKSDSCRDIDLGEYSYGIEAEECGAKANDPIEATGGNNGGKRFGVVTGSCPSLRLSREVHSSSSLETAAGGEGWTEIPTPLREAASTEKGLLERALEHHQEETRRRLMNLQRPESGPELEGNSGDDDGEAKRSVRYNDTGSREEIREEDLSVISPSPPTTSESEAQEEEEAEEYMEEGPDYESMRTAYRQLWELRATFEEEEELSDTLRLDDEEEEEDGDNGASAELVSEEKTDCQDDTIGCCGASRVSPEREASSQTTSFESNTEPCAQDDEPENETSKIEPEGSSGEGRKDEQETKIYSNLLSLPTTESRRSSFTNRMGKRLKRSCPASKGPPSDSQDVSAASFDSVETEWSSTEASRTGEDPSTSFESTTTTTDYNTDSSATESLQSRRLHQMKADSGYKSIESNGRRPPKLSRGKPMRSTMDGDSIEELEEGCMGKSVCEPVVINCTTSPGEHSAVLLIGPNVTAAMIEKSKSMSALKKRLQPWKECPPTTLQITASKSMTITTCGTSVTSTTLTTVVVPSTSTYATAPTISDDVIVAAPLLMKVELDTDRITGGGLSPSPSTSSSITSDIRGKISVFQRFFRSSRPTREERLHRDFSIDEKSDALFREFSRQDPSLDQGSGHRSRSSASWRQSHLRLHHPHPYQYPPHHGLVHQHAHHHPPPLQHHAPLPVHHHSHHKSTRWAEMQEDIEMSVLTGKGSIFSPQLSIDEEIDIIDGFGRRSLSREALSERSLVLQDIPVIRLPAE